MKKNLLTAVTLLAALLWLAAPVFAQDEKAVEGSQKGAISGSVEDNQEPEPKPEDKREPKSPGFKFPGFSIGLNVGATVALLNVEGGFGGEGVGIDIGLTAGAYPLLFGEVGTEVMEFDLTTESDKDGKREVKGEMSGYYAGGGVGLPLGGGEESGGIGFRWRILRKSRVKLRIKNQDTEETEIIRSRTTRRSYFIFIAMPGDLKNPKKGRIKEVGLRYDYMDKNIFLFSSVLGFYFRLLILF